MSPMAIADLLDGVGVAPKANASSKRQAMSMVAEVAARAFGIAAPLVLEPLLEREAAEPTGIGHGVAIPHAQVAGLDRIRGVFIRLETPVEFGAVDDEPVDLIFALFTPRDSGPQRLLALARISRLLRQASLREQLRRARSGDAIYALLAREGLATAA